MRVLCIIASIFLGFGCKSTLPKQHVFPKPVDTQSKVIQEQEKRTFAINSVYASNTFDGARLNFFQQVNDSTYRATITPENEPINESAYFCFEMWSDNNRSIDLELYYPDHKHRYIPKLSFDRQNWIWMDSTQFDTIKSGDLATLKLNLDPRHQYVCAQELMTTTDNLSWCESLDKKHSNLHLRPIGKSKRGRDIYFMDLYEGDKEKKDAIVIMSRQHPPEISGYIAMQEFVETILKDEPISNQFRKKYRVLIYPMVNPDGVDMGHWRHNAGGIDLNRDWAYYRQDEPNLVAKHMVRSVKENKNKVLVGLDFHSTQKDILYTLTPNRITNVAGFKDAWVQGLDNAIENHDPNDAPYDLNTPITKGWFYLEFGAEGITYEVGDETPRDFVKEKATIAARELMKLLIFKN